VEKRPEVARRTAGHALDRVANLGLGLGLGGEACVDESEELRVCLRNAVACEVRGELVGRKRDVAHARGARRPLYK